MISVLLVDDEPVLLDIGRMFLERSGEFRVGEADSGSVALERLNNDSFDAIVADYEMPGMDGLVLLRKVRETWPDLPYILFTGRGREEVVIEALNSGADFYLQKGGDPKAQFTELSHKIKQAVASRRASSKLKEREEVFRQFFDAAGDAIIILDGGRITDCNKKSLDILGRDRDQIVGENPDHLFDPVLSDGKKIQNILREITDNSSATDSHSHEWRILKGDNSWLDTEVTLSSIMIQGRELIHAIIRDISSRKAHEEVLRINEIRLRAMLALYTVQDKSMKEITDFSLEQALAITGSKNGYLAFLSEDESILTIYSGSGGTENYKKQGNPKSYTVSKTGRWGDAIRFRKPIITNQYETGLEKEQELPDNFHPIIRHMNVPVFDQNRLVLLAGVVNKDEPYTEEEVHQMTILMSGMWGIVRRKKTEDLLVKKNSELMVAYDQLRTIERELQEKYDDIRIRSAELTEIEDRFRCICNLAPVYIVIGDDAGHIIYINNKWRELTGNYAALPDRIWNEAIHPEDKSQIMQSFQKSISQMQPDSIEIRVIDKNENVFWFLSTSIPRLTQDGRILGIIDVSIDITEQKLGKEALRECEERYRLLVEQG